MRMKMQARKDIPLVHEPRSVTRIDFGDHYPDGGWGWAVVSAATIVYSLCHGFHFAYGILMKVAHENFTNLDTVHTVWLGSIGISISLLVSPIVTTICRRKSPRLFAVIGGLVVSLGSLFLAFSNQVEHMFVSHCLVLSVGSGITVNTANIIVGRYFKERRELAEMIMLSGTGVGAALLSFLMDDLIRKISWVTGMQSIAGLLAVTMVAGAMYRSASLYHPRRNVILHIKNQKKCRREREQEKPPYFDFTALRMRGLQGLMLAVAIIGLGIHTPFIMLLRTARESGVPSESLVLLNIFLGVGYAVGCYIFGYIIIRDSSDCSISRRHLTQTCAITSGALTLLLVMAKDMHAFSLYACAYGVTSGGYNYCMKMYTYRLVKEKIMERGWGFINAAQFLSFLLGPPFAIYMNESQESETACYVFSGSMLLTGGFVLYFMPLFERHYSNHEIIQRYQCACSKNTTEAAALLDLDLTNAMVTKPLNNVQFIVSPSRMKHTHGKDCSKIQMQCFIQHRDKEKPKQIVLSRITEEKEGLRLDFNEVSTSLNSSSSSGSSNPKQASDGISKGKSVSEKDLSLPICENHCGDMPSESTNSNHTDKSHKGSHSSRAERKFRQSSDNVKMDYFDPPSQEKESTATVSYDSDLYINLCEAQV